MELSKKERKEFIKKQSDWTPNSKQKFRLEGNSINDSRNPERRSDFYGRYYEYKCEVCSRWLKAKSFKKHGRRKDYLNNCNLIF